MTVSDQPRGQTLIRRLGEQPYLLLSLTSLFWAGNIIVGRHLAGLVPPFTLSFIRWGGATLLILPFAWRHLITDWPAIRSQIGLMLFLSITGISIYNTLAYYGLQYTQALNGLLLQSSGPLFVALWSLCLLGVRLTWAQALGITTSLIGVLTILTRGDLAALAAIRFNTGDLLFTTALAIFGLYSALSVKRPQIHGLSFLAFTITAGALALIPLVIWDVFNSPPVALTASNLLSLAYVVIFPSTLGYLCFNRGVQLIGANRAAPFFHLMPVFGAAMAILFLGERPELFHLIGFALVLTGVFVAARK
jgi:drug/metabolite transporter (DMT)-like permease